MDEHSTLFGAGECLRIAEFAEEVRRALRLVQLQRPLQERERESLNSGLRFLDGALRAATVPAANAIVSSTFTSDADNLRQLLNLRRPDRRLDLDQLRRVLAEALEDGSPSREDVDDALRVFRRLGARSLDSARQLAEAGRPAYS